jgi:hypothetical protein
MLRHSVLMIRWINTTFGSSWMELFVGIGGVRVGILDTDEPNEGTLRCWVISISLHVLRMDQ